MAFVPFTLNAKGRLLLAQEPKVMGIINTTPDSFFAGSRQQQSDALLQKAGQMLAEGAWMLDVGGQSTRPGASQISAAEEADRVLPAIEAIHKWYPDALLSIDTFYASVARQALRAGAVVVNDVSGGQADAAMLEVVAAAQAIYVCMHSRGNAATMHTLTHYNHLVSDIIDFFIERNKAIQLAGITDWLLDPGFGFAKTSEQNFHLLHHLPSLHMLQKPLLVGLSRKGMVYKTLGCTAAEALNGTTVLHTLALQNGAGILRVHDVRAAVEAIQLVAATAGAKAWPPTQN